MRFLRPLAQKTCKVLAVDLDNTLWGGVVGEDGPDGDSYWRRLSGFRVPCLQRELKALQRRGVLLAICSKNNPNDALAVLRDHPEMLLRPEDFAAVRMNWDDKAANLRAIASGVERRRRGGGTARRQSRRARLGAFSAAGCAHHRGHERSARDDRGVAAIAGIRAAGAFGTRIAPGPSNTASNRSAPPPPSPRTRSKTSCARSR